MATQQEGEKQPHGRVKNQELSLGSQHIAVNSSGLQRLAVRRQPAWWGLPRARPELPRSQNSFPWRLPSGVPSPPSGAFGERQFPVPHRTPAPTPGHQSCQEEPCFGQHQHPPPEPAPLLFPWHPGPFTELPGDSRKPPCPGSHAPFPTLPRAAPVLITAGSCKPVGRGRHERRSFPGL